MCVNEWDTEITSYQKELMIKKNKKKAKIQTIPKILLIKSKNCHNRIRRISLMEK